MLQVSSNLSGVMEAANHSKNSVMEAEKHVKHRACSKSRTNRGNISKRALLSAVYFIFLSCACFAQDILLTKDFRKIKGEVTEVNEGSIKYKNKDGRVYTLQKSDITSIFYQNGEIKTLSLTDYNLLTKREIKQFVIPEMKSNYPELLAQHNTGKTMAYTGAAVTLIGAACLAYTAIGYFSWDEGSGEGMKDSHMNAMYVGIPLALGGITLVAIGEMKSKRAFNDFAYRMSESSVSQLPKPYFRLNVYPNRVGIAYVF
jgi:hypothetical protein